MSAPLSEWVQDMGHRLLDWLGILLLILVGAAIASGVFLLRVIPDREQTAAQKAHEEADKRVAEIREKIAAARAEREAKAAAEREKVCKEAPKADPASSVATANSYIEDEL